MQVCRNFSHVLKSTEKASSLKDLRKSKTQLLHPHQLLPFGWKWPTVKCPSVFNKNQDVLLLLSREELMEAYDLELNSQSSLQSYWIKS